MVKRNQRILVTHLCLYLWQDTQVAEFRGWRESKSRCRDRASSFLPTKAKSEKGAESTDTNNKKDG